MTSRSRYRTYPPCDYKYIRQIGPDSFEARLRFLNHRRNRNNENLSLGSYPSARAAWGAAIATIKQIDPRLPHTMETLYRAALAAMAAGHVRPDLLPKYVRRLPCGKMIGRIRCRSGEVLYTGEYDDPILAHREAIVLIQRCVSLAA